MPQVLMSLQLKDPVSWGMARALYKLPLSTIKWAFLTFLSQGCPCGPICLSVSVCVCVFLNLLPSSCSAERVERGPEAVSFYKGSHSAVPHHFPCQSLLRAFSIRQLAPSHSVNAKPLISTGTVVLELWVTTICQTSISRDSFIMIDNSSKISYDAAMKIILWLGRGGQERLTKVGLAMKTPC